MSKLARVLRYSIRKHRSELIAMLIGLTLIDFCLVVLVRAHPAQASARAFVGTLGSFIGVCGLQVFLWGLGIRTELFSNSFSVDQDGKGEEAGPVGAGIGLEVALVGPDKDRRRVVAGVLERIAGVQLMEIDSYPPLFRDLPEAMGRRFQVIIVDIDSDLDYACELVDRFCAMDLAFVAVYSEQPSPGTMLRFMRAGVREFFIFPPDPEEMASALRRAAEHWSRFPHEQAFGKIEQELDHSRSEGMINRLRDEVTYEELKVRLAQLKQQSQGMGIVAERYEP